MADGDNLEVRLWVMIGEVNDSLINRLDQYKLIGYGNHHLTVRAIKRLMDGALGTHGAWLLEPYSDLPSTSGINFTPLDELKETAEMAIKNGFQLCMHAIGDRGNRETLNIYQNTFNRHDNPDDLRWRIEHAQHLHPDDIIRFKSLGVLVAMQTNHCSSDGPWVPKRIGDERSEEGAHVWQKLIQSGALICNGTDYPVEDIDPFANFYSAITRELPDGSTFYPDQCLSRHQALYAYTKAGAYAGFEENIKGSLEPGKLADIVVLSADIMEIPAEQIPSTTVVYTIVGGQIMYRAPGISIL